MNNDLKDLWVFKYEPKSLNEMCVHPDKKVILNKILTELPNTLIAGKPGTGKGTFMNILLNQNIDDKKLSVLKINASMENSIDDIRTKVSKFARAYDTNIKIVYLNEADRISQAGQDGLRQLMEDVNKNCRFFFVANNEEKITDAIKSRCGYHLDLNDPKGKDILVRCLQILKKENIKVKSKSALVELIKKCYPDIRKTIGVLQANCIDGELNNITYSSISDLYETIFQDMLLGEIEKVRKSLKSNYIDYDDLFNHIYKRVMDESNIVKIPGEFILTTGEYLYKNSLVGIKEINFMAYFFDMMKKSII